MRGTGQSREQHFEMLGLKKVITTCYNNRKADLFSERGLYFEYSGEQKKQRLPDSAKIKPRELKADGGSSWAGKADQARGKSSGRG